MIAHVIEGDLIAPLAQQRASRLPPLPMLASQALLGTLFGLTGDFLAAPIAAASMVVARMIYVQDILGEEAARGRRKAASPDS